MLFLGVNAQSPYINYSYTVDLNGNYTYTFTPDKVKLEQDYPLDYSNPEADYTFFWSFGDGDYSFKEEIVHTYKSTQTIDVMLIATPRYSPIDPPPAFYSFITVHKGNYSNVNDDPMVLISREPRPAYNSFAIVNYENTLSIPIQKAKLRFYFNTQHFEYFDEQLFNSEMNISTTTDTALLPKYDNYITYDVGNLAPKEKHTILIELQTLLGAMGDLGEPLPELYLRAELYYEVNSSKGIVEYTVQDYTMVTKAVGGWDPNDKLALTNSLFYNNMAAQEWVDYRINFQNIGLAPAKNVEIIDTFSFDLDSSTFVFNQYYHPKKAIYSGFSYVYDSATRILKCNFSNINLDGTKQRGITNMEETKGYVEFKIKTMRKQIFNPSLFTHIDSCLPYYQIENRAYISFDNADTIATNIATTDLYISSNASCFTPHSSSTPLFTVVPNPIKGGNIVIRVTNLPPTFGGFNTSNISFNLYNSTFSTATCSLNPSFSSLSTNHQITLHPSCLSTGINYLVIIFSGQTYLVLVVK
ncbi:MAG: hypothetical protein COA58_14810 [Bacteroidetes bacterium]|nr:MAG: hypothetical protein COA58_14810 [Bacteroidota bacterium]